MKEVVTEGAHFLYVLGSEPAIAETVMGFSVALTVPFMERAVMNALDLRLIVEEGLPSQAALVYFLHWDNDQDLALLDRKIQEGSHESADFEHSVKTVYQITACDGCGTQWRTLVTPPGDAYRGAPDLLRKKIREHRYIRECPSCGTSFRQLVAKIFAMR